MMAYPPAPPLLLMRRLSTFLHTSLETLRENAEQQSAATTLQTALLVTPAGKLLAYESPLPVRTLRTHCSVAASLWTIHSSSSPSVAVALDQTAPVASSGPPTNAPPLETVSSPTLSPTRPAEGEEEEEEPYHDGSKPESIAVSFDGGAVFFVRQLRCGLLFACSTTAPNASASRPGTASGLVAKITNDTAATATPESASAPSPSPAPAAGLTQSSLLPTSKLPAPPPPTDTAAVSTAPAVSLSTEDNPEPSASGSASIAVPTRPSDGHAGSHPPGASVKTTTTTETYETAPSGHDRDVDADADADASAEGDRDANADAASTTTTGTTTTVGGSKAGSVAAVVAITRRQVDELVQLLDEKLGSLTVPDENIGNNGFC